MKIYTNDNPQLPFRRRVRQFELELLTQALQESGYNQSEAARVLKLDRSTFRRLLARWEKQNPSPAENLSFHEDVGNA